MSEHVNDIEYQNKPNNNGKAVIGMVLLIIGGLLLVRQFSYFLIPGWIWEWPTWLIVAGLYIGAKHNYRRSIWFILVFIGLAGTLNNAIPGLHIGNLIWPGMIIMIGLWIILRRNHSGANRNKWEKQWEQKWEYKWQQKWDKHYHTPIDPQPQTPAGDETSGNVPPVNPNARPITGDDFLDATSIFGGVKKTILSKNFRGGDITNIFGGAEIDLTQADIDGKVVLDITQLFGGTKIIVPPHWQVISNLSAVFAGVDDKRLRKVGAGDNNKILVLEGVSIFAGVEIRTF